MSDNHSPPLPAPAPTGRWTVVVTMNESGGVHVAQHTPSADFSAMLLYRALAFLERELLVARMRQDDRPRIQVPGRPL